MKGFVELVGISNFVRLEDGASENRLIIKLPNGTMIDPPISDEHLATVVESFGAPPPPTEPSKAAIKDLSAYTGVDESVVLREKQDNGEEALVFGAPPTPQPVPAPAPPPPPRKSKVLGTDDAGNPIVQLDGEDPASVTGEGGIKDEDGVAQL